jgi:hypothetical protein
MFTFRIIRRQNARTTTRRPEARRRGPLVEALEGRQLLSTFTPADIKKAVAAVALSHTVAPFDTAIQGNHIGVTVDSIQGNHIGTNVAAVQWGVGRGISSPTVAAIQGNHIGVTVDSIAGSHIGTNVAAVQVIRPGIIVLE